MSDCILLDGDQAMFSPAFGAATVVVQPGALTATGPATMTGKKMCVAGDEKSVSVPGCSYVTPTHSIPGVGTLEINALASDQTATKTQSGGKPLLRVGSTFTAVFMVQSPAQQPTATGPVPDSTPRYTGTGTFLGTNQTFQGA